MVWNFSLLFFLLKSLWVFFQFLFLTWVRGPQNFYRLGPPLNLSRHWGQLMVIVSRAGLRVVGAPGRHSLWGPLYKRGAPLSAAGKNFFWPRGEWLINTKLHSIINWWTPFCPFTSNFSNIFSLLFHHEQALVHVHVLQQDHTIHHAVMPLLVNQ